MPDEIDNELNDNVLQGIACPECKATEPFDIEGTATFLRVENDGCSDFMGLAWTDESWIQCKSCGHVGTIKGFSI